MADYYPLLARALDALPDRTPALRTAVYERARNALVAQLRSLDPPLSEADIDLERRALDAAIDRLEADYADPRPAATPPASSAPPSPPPPSPPPSSPPPADPAPGPVPATPPGPPPMPVASPPVFRPPEPEPDPPRPAAIPISPRRAKPAPESAPPAVEPEAEADAEPPPSVAEAGGGRQRPRIEVVAPRRGGSRLVRNAVVGFVLALVIGGIAVAAYLLRDQPAALQTAEGTETSAPSSDGETKFSDRIGGEGQAAERGPPGAADARPAAAPGQPDLAVAQRAVLLEENGAAQTAQPTTSPGRVVWRLDSVSGEQGQPLQTAVVAVVGFPEAGLSLQMTVQRNLDATLPASHTVSLAFTNTGGTGERRAVQDVGLLQAKDDENGRGSSVSGLPVRVRENLFLIGLSSLRADVDRNTDLLLHRNWFDIALRYTSGQRAVVSFEKGNSGTYVLQRAFEQWR